MPRRLRLGLVSCCALLLLGCSKPAVSPPAESAEQPPTQSQIQELKAEVKSLSQQVDQIRDDQQRLVDLTRSRIDRTGGKPGQLVTVYYWDQLTPDLLPPVEVLVPAKADPLRATVEALVAGLPEAGPSIPTS